MSALHLVADLCQDLLQCLIPFFLWNFLERGMLIPEVVLVNGHRQNDDVSTPGWNLRVMLNSSALVKLISETCIWFPAIPDATGRLLFHSQDVSVVIFLMIIVLVMTIMVV